MRRRPSFLAFGLALAVAACSNGGSGILAVTDSWAPTTPPGAQAAVVYLTIENGTAAEDRLVSVTADRCGTIELHATQFDENHVMRMRLAEPELLAIPAGDTMEMAPGGLHVMCVAPPSPFRAGEELDLTVSMETAGDLSITAIVANR
jgi:copper(I)-binding protein